MENSSVNRNDILGLSKVLPVDKLLDLVGDFIGAISKPHRDRWDIKTEVIRIKKLSEAFKNAASEGIKLEYTPSGLVLKAEQDSLRHSLTPEFEELIDRTAKRLILQEIRKELNIVNVVSHAGNILEAETEVSAEKVDNDWIANFFRIVEDVSNEEMQVLWGQLLAGEIAKPKSFSRRTLETLKLLTTEDATLFKDVAGFAIRDLKSRVAFIDKQSQKDFLPFPKIVHLREIGLISDGDNLQLDIKVEPSASMVMYNGDNTIDITNESVDAIKVTIGVYLFTKVGEELLRLVDSSAIPQYTDLFVKRLIRDGFKASCATKIGFDSDGNLIVSGPPKY